MLPLKSMIRSRKWNPVQNENGSATPWLLRTNHTFSHNLGTNIEPWSNNWTLTESLLGISVYKIKIQIFRNQLLLHPFFSQNSNPCLDPLFICLSVFANGYDFAVIFAYVIDTAESSSGVCLHSGVKLNRVILTQRRFICHRGVRSVFCHDLWYNQTQVFGRTLLCQN